ncbi:hypothetical protein LOTGIDRAFT_237960 [Lottia gigantea]|uniref:Transcription factor TFIIIC triple barrel domain-containing protein n=1 Tax=Lottia gigantea TaxID=225164 RepID=V4B4Q3_LOTGI|nr:hypothetical protein LOTGIDRAFT_237960 [Lottia gigantea]ESP02456.1 hypothetical protein LOTGIDRAFT_237960 [Lottia gigantea]
MDDDCQIEETTVVVELNGLTDTEFLKKDNVQCKVLGINTEKPLLQLGTNIFSGEYKDSVGTYLLLNKKSEQDAGVSDVEYHSKTTKTLVMHRTFLNEKTGDIAPHFWLMSFTLLWIPNTGLESWGQQLNRQ